MKDIDKIMGRMAELGGIDRSGEGVCARPVLIDASQGREIPVLIKDEVHAFADAVEEGHLKLMSRFRIRAYVPAFGIASEPELQIRPYPTVTDFARLRGWSTSVPFSTAT